jgi:ribosomal-protein-alanine N-acetyltransferase
VSSPGHPGAGAGAPLTVRTARLLLRPLHETDRDEYLRVARLSRDHFAPWSPATPPAMSPSQQFQQELERAVKGEREGTACRRVAIVLDTALVARVHGGAMTPDGFPIAAMVNLNNIVRGVFQSADMGWRVSAEFTRRGLGVEAVSAMLDLAFAAPPRGLGLHRVQANVIPANAASLRLAEKVGFRREGLAKRMLCIAGAWQDHVMFAKLADEHECVYL